MNDKEDIFEKYRRELMEMHKRARQNTENTEEKFEEPVEEPSEEPSEESAEEYAEESLQNDEEPPFCRLCGGKIALCEFIVESVKTGRPIENAQVMLYRSDGFFVRTLTDEKGQTCEIPVFADELWRISVTAEGYISVSKAMIEPAAGEKLSVPVRLDESLSLSDIFTEHKGSILGSEQDYSV